MRCEGGNCRNKKTPAQNSKSHDEANKYRGYNFLLGIICVCACGCRASTAVSSTPHDTQMWRLYSLLRIYRVVRITSLPCLSEAHKAQGTKKRDCFQNDKQDAQIYKLQLLHCVQSLRGSPLVLIWLCLFKVKFAVSGYILI